MHTKINSSSGRISGHFVQWDIQQPKSRLRTSNKAFMSMFDMYANLLIFRAFRCDKV